MARSPDIEGWILIGIALPMGVLAAWWADSHHLNENWARAVAYTFVVFLCLVMALRRAWRRWRLWVDLALLLMLHAALVLPMIDFLGSHSIRLNWVVALPFVALELLLFLGLLWRRNVVKSSS
jgi:hypothetical protein